MCFRSKHLCSSHLGRCEVGFQGMCSFRWEADLNPETDGGQDEACRRNESQEPAGLAVASVFGHLDSFFMMLLFFGANRAAADTK